MDRKQLPQLLGLQEKAVPLSDLTVRCGFLAGSSPDYDNYTSPSNDVWYSSDGITWTEATASAAWSARCLHNAVVYDSEVYVMDGTYDNGIDTFS